MGKEAPIAQNDEGEVYNMYELNDDAPAYIRLRN